jgi:hypothetical protein
MSLSLLLSVVPVAAAGAVWGRHCTPVIRRRPRNDLAIGEPDKLIDDALDARCSMNKGLLAPKGENVHVWGRASGN